MADNELSECLNLLEYLPKEKQIELFAMMKELCKLPPEQARKTIEKLMGNKITEKDKLEFKNFWEKISESQILEEHSEIKNSNVHGKGLFASKNLNRGDPVTFYPFDMIIKTGTSKIFRNILKNENLVYLNTNYKLCVGNYSFVGDPEILKPGFLGHMTNDSCKVTIDDIKHTKKQIRNKIAEYYLNSNNNCVFENGYVVALKEIKKGEEILTGYGFNYWYYTQVCKNNSMSHEELVELLTEPSMMKVCGDKF